MTIDPRHRQELIERVASAFRERDAHGSLRTSPAFHDLDDEGRREAFETALTNRSLEAALDPAGLSTTAKSVLARIRRGG